MPRELNIMFWNIQNVYEYKTVTPSEFATEKQIPEESAMKRQRMNAVNDNAKKLQDVKGVSHRSAVTTIMLAAQKPIPDIIVVVELAVAKTDLVTGGLYSAQRRAIAYEHFGAFQWLLNLKHLEKTSDWECAISDVNASDILADLTADGKITGILNTNTNATHSNTLFEQYAVFWNRQKVNIKPPAGTDVHKLHSGRRIEILNQDIHGNALNFPQRNPGFIEFVDNNGIPVVSIAMIHSYFGKKSSSEDKLKRADVIKNMAKLKALHDTLNCGGRLVVTGDFNVDMITDAKDYDPLTNLGLMSLIHNEKTSFSAKGLASAYDQIFVSKNLLPARGSSFNFVEEHYVDNYGKGLMVSDHLPVYASITLP